MEKIDKVIECPTCEGTGIYKGMAEGPGMGVICYRCKGTGAFHYVYEYKPFTGRKIREDIKRVYKKGTQYKIGLGVIEFEGIGKIDMDKEGVSYKEFLKGKMPKHITKLECPMLADQGACHKIEGFTKKCNELNGGWIGHITRCKFYPRKEECWTRFYNAVL